MAAEYRVVVAEDEELLLHSLVKKIEQTNLGFTVIGTAQTGEQAYQLIKENTPDLLITDIRMPVMNGMELIAKLHQRFPGLRVIIISGFSDFSYAQEAIRHQVFEYLLKPIDNEELYQTLFHVKTGLVLEQQSYETLFQGNFECSTPEQLAAVLHEYIVNHFTDNINLNLIANSLNYSPGYLTKVFLQEYNCSPSKFIISLRIQKAQFLLHTTDLSIRQIGEAVGYPEQGYFSRIFKKQTGSSPYEYREENV